jgi:hypothetical protein
MGRPTKITLLAVELAAINGKNKGDIARRLDVSPQSLSGLLTRRGYTLVPNNGYKLQKIKPGR